ncbi:MAG: hypothetical protein O7G85_06720, partial [Planctomycetota bacterium]|nr:hypothetical protein [Planctomycetota bacterium]
MRKTLSERIPDDLDVDDASALGAWLGRRLHQAGMPLDSAILALPREFVALKRLTLPTASDVELPEMAKLAMQRELPFDPETAVIDFAPVTRGVSSTTVIVVAVPREVLDHAQRLAKAA